MRRTGAARSNGCKTCRRRRIKCDERHPMCVKCQRAGYECEGYVREHRFVDEVPRVIRESQRDQGVAIVFASEADLLNSAQKGRWAHVNTDTPSQDTRVCQDSPVEACTQNLDATTSLFPESPAVTAYFRFVGETASPVTIAFSRTSLLPLFSNPVPIRRVVEAIGTVKIQSACDGVLDQSFISQMRTQFRPCLESLLASSGDRLGHSTLVFAMLLAIFELMTDETGFGFIKLMTILMNYTISESIGPQSALLRDCERSLLIFYRIMEAYRALNIHGDSPIAGLMPYKWDKAQVITPLETEFVVYEHFCNLVLAFLRCDIRSRQWEQKVKLMLENNKSASTGYSAETIKSTFSSPENAQLLASGREILREANQEIDLIRDFHLYQIQEPSGPANFFTLVPAFHSSFLVCFTRLFTNSAWSVVNSELDTLPGAAEISQMKKHTDIVLDAIDARLTVTGLEAVLYCPLMYPISIEARDAKSRNRVRGLYERIAEKGVIVSMTYLSDISLIWDMLPVIEEDTDHSACN